MKLSAQIIPSIAENLPVLFIVGTPKYHGANFYSWNGVRNALVNRLIQFTLPQTADSINPANLLFNGTRIPFGMEQHDRPASFVEIKPLTTYH